MSFFPVWVFQLMEGVLSCKIPFYYRLCLSVSLIIGASASPLAGLLPICVGQRNPWHSNDWSCKGIGQWPHKALKLINVTLERPLRNNCDGFMTIAQSLKKSNLLINGYSKPLQWLRETIAMAPQNHCNGFAKPLQWK